MSWFACPCSSVVILSDAGKAPRERGVPARFCSYTSRVAEKLIHEVIPVGLLQCNRSILGDPAAGEALVVDPGDEPERILEILRRHKLKPRAIVSTHTHIDHVGGLAALHRATGARPDPRSRPSALSWPRRPGRVARRSNSCHCEDRFVCEGRRHAALGRLHGGRAAYTRADAGKHQPCAGRRRRAEQGQAETPPAVASAEAFGGRHAFCRQYRAHGSVGRFVPEIIQSIKEKPLGLPDETIVYSGHGETTTIGAEREFNPFLR
jgi:hydroxyacylglutathione hydrolase